MPRILHLGLGNFHRAHQAVYTANAGGDWHITGVAMRNRALRETMVTQGGYWLGVRGVDGLSTQKITLHDRILLASEQGPDVVAAFADPNLAIVTATVTEKGYHLDGTTGSLDLSDPAVLSDFNGAPTTAIGLLAHGLVARMNADAGPLTVISCDNLSNNGTKLRTALQDFDAAASLGLDEYMAESVQFPNTMVDRITPSSGPHPSQEIAAVCGEEDPIAVLTEAFSEWVIEDRFAGTRPAWETAGARIVPDVVPFEMRKLRLLNAAHSFLAYAGLLRGHDFVHEAIADPDLRADVDQLWDEAESTLPEAVTTDGGAYRAALISRFSVPEMRHSLAQIAMDGSLKIRERLGPVVLARLAAGQPAPQATRAIAAWVLFAKATVTAGQPLADANAETVTKLVSQTPDGRHDVDGLCHLLGLGRAPADWREVFATQIKS